MQAMKTQASAPEIRYALTPRPAAGGRVDLVLDLHRDGVPALTRTIARVERSQLARVMVACRRHLERRDVASLAPAAMAPAARRRPAAADVLPAAPLAAFDWMFAS